MKDLTKIRTDAVGSLLRPAYLKQARMGFDAGSVSAPELRLIEDRAVREAVLLQEQAGLEIVTDGEFRRLNFEESFGTSVSGFGGIRADTKFYEERARMPARSSAKRFRKCGGRFWTACVWSETFLSRNFCLSVVSHKSLQK